MMVIIRPGLKVVIQLRTLLLKRIQMVQELIMDQRQKVLSLVSESNAWVSHKRRQRAWHNMMVTPKLGLTHVTQLKIPLLKRIQVVLELMIRVLEALSQVLVLNAWASLKDTLTLMFSMMATNRTGLTNATHLRTLLPKRTQVELVLTRMRRLVVPSQESVSIAKASLKRANPLTDLDQKLLSSKIAQTTFQTATVPMVLKVLTAAEHLKAL